AFQITEEAPLTSDQQQRVVRPQQFYSLATLPATETTGGQTAEPPVEDTAQEGEQPRRFVGVPTTQTDLDGGETGSEEEPPAEGRRYTLNPIPATETPADSRRAGLYVTGDALTPAFQIGEEPPVARPAAPVQTATDEPEQPEQGTRFTLNIDRNLIRNIVSRVQADAQGVRPDGSTAAQPERAADPNALPDQVRFAYVEHSSDASGSFLRVKMSDPRTANAMRQLERYFDKPYIQARITEILHGRNARGHRTHYDTMMMRSLKYGNPFRGMIEDAFEGWNTPSVFGYRSLWESKFLRHADYPNNETNDRSSARGLGQFLTDTAGGGTVRMRVGGGVDDERRFAAASLCGMAKYFDYFLDYFPHDSTLGFLAYHAGEGSKRRTNHAGVQGYARAMLGSLDAVRARNYAFTYHELVEANVIPAHKEDWANNSIATTFILQNPTITGTLQ
ncbi:MAG: hypothetical protein AAF202_11390, partial [Pseudomonadota bacterium]